MTASERSELDHLMERCIIALEDEDEAAVAALVDAHPEHAATLRERIDQLAQIGMLHRPREDDLIPDRIGEFKLLKQIGRGGMGAVFVAEQENLQRQVAIKLLRPDQLLFQGARERFRREVLAIARLSHPGIVPILTGGEVDGMPFYTMDLVEGASLGELLHELAGNDPAALDGIGLRRALARTLQVKGDDTTVSDAPVFHGAWVQVCCRLLLAAAEAIQHAHERRVLHRDIKPSNVLLTRTGEARVIDFGLASAEGEQRITRSGASFGSVPYMAPEQVRGDVDRIDARTDVYGLGVTFYELLTLTLPFGDGASTRDRVVQGNYEPPTRRNPLVHPDVEAICTKAMDIDPTRRYPTAADLAEDLRAFLEQRTVRARRPSPWLRLRRWGTRNPMRAAAMLLAFLVLVPGPLLFAWQRHSAASEIVGALDEAEYSLDQALEAVDRMLIRTADARLSEIPRTAHLRRQLLEDAIEFHERLAGAARRAGDSQRIREARARSRSRLGALQADLGQVDQAITTLTAATRDCEQLLPESTNRPRLQGVLARSLRRLGAALGSADDYVAAEAALARAVTIYHELATTAPNADNIEAAMFAQLSHATSLSRLRQFERALEGLDQLDATLQQPDSSAALPELRRTILRSRVADHRGVLFSRRGDSRAALASFERAVELLDEVETKLDPATRRSRLGAIERLGFLLIQRRLFDRALPFLQRAAKGYEEMAVREPEMPRWRERLAQIQGTLSGLRRQRGDVTGALTLQNSAVATLQVLATQFSDTPRYQRMLALAIAELAECELATGQPDRAFANFETAAAELEACLAHEHERPRTRGNLVAVLANHAAALQSQGHFERAGTVRERALQLARTNANESSNTRSQQALINLLDQASELALRRKDETKALELADECRRRAAASLAQAPEDALRQETLARVALNAGITLVATGQSADARACWEDALDAARQAVQHSPDSSRLLALLLLRLTEFELEYDQLPTARQWFAAALTETTITPRDLPNYATLRALFEHPKLADLVRARTTSK